MAYARLGEREAALRHYMKATHWADTLGPKERPSPEIGHLGAEAAKNLNLDPKLWDPTFAATAPTTRLAPAP
jgi:hypothetical protein